MSGSHLDPAGEFSATYAEARGKFLQAARHHGWHLESHERGSYGAIELFTDVACWGPPQANRVILTTSGLHGIEGFFGSAVQLQMFPIVKGFADRLTNVRIVQIHALNPYGFAALRRFDERNIDQNRNFVPSDADYRGAPELYGKLNRFLNPPAWPRLELPFRIQAMFAILRYGLPALRDAIARGQYEYPQGLFFGGRSRCSTYELLETYLENWIGAARHVLHLDFHTGLGAFGEYELYCDHPLANEQRSELTAAFGHHLRELHHPDRSYIALGSLTRWMHARFPEKEVASLCAEFGTYDAVSVLGALRAENGADHHAPEDSSVFTRAKRQLLEMFCPGSENWRQTVLQAGRELLESALTLRPTAERP